MKLDPHAMLVTAVLGGCALICCLRGELPQAFGFAALIVPNAFQNRTSGGMGAAISAVTSTDSHGSGTLAVKATEETK